MTDIDELSGHAARRYGRFSIDRSLFETAYHHFALALSRCAVVRAELDFASDSIDYIAIGAAFTPVPVGMLIPEYDLVFHNLDAAPHVAPRITWTMMK